MFQSHGGGGGIFVIKCHDCTTISGLISTKHELHTITIYIWYLLVQCTVVCFILTDLLYVYFVELLMDKNGLYNINN